MTLFAEYVPENNRRRFAFEVVDLKLLRALENLRIISTGLAQPREIALHVCHEHRHATRAEIFSECLECHRFSCSGSTSDQAVTIRHLRQQKNFFLRLRNEDWFVRHRVDIDASAVRLLQPPSTRPLIVMATIGRPMRIVMSGYGYARSA